MVDILLMEDNPADIALFEIGISDSFPNCSLNIIDSKDQLITILENAFTNKNLSGKIVILDLFTPNNDGLEILKTVRKNNHLQFLPIIILTNTREISIAEKAYQMGANAFLFKPNDYDEFIAMLNGIINFFQREG